MQPILLIFPRRGASCNLVLMFLGLTLTLPHGTKHVAKGVDVELFPQRKMNLRVAVILVLAQFLM
jgi:hypothetical protein